MSKTYRPYENDQMFLMPPSLTDWLPAGHLVFFLRDVLDKIDLSPITRRYEEEERGYPPYHPKMMTGILLYGYSNGITSSRKLARHCQEDVAFRVLAANNQPDFRTISDFRKMHLRSLEHIFVQMLQLCQKAGLVKFGHISLDGTKIKANASKHKAMSYGRMKQDIVRLKKEISDLLRESERTDAREDQTYGRDKRGDELPDELTRRETRLVKIQEAKRALEQEAREQAQDVDEKPKPPSSGAPGDLPMAKIKTVPNQQSGTEEIVPKAQRSFTDADSRIMPYQQTFIQGYNAQVAVDDNYQIIVATDVSNNPVDNPLLPAMVARLPKKPKALSADAGYSLTEENLTYLKKRRIDAYIAIKGNNPGLSPPRGRIPRDLTIKERMKRKLLTKKGHRIYARRKCIAEPPIGQIKHVQGFRQFSLRGYAKVRAEWFLVTATHNLRKLFRACCEQPRRRKLIFAG